VRFMRVQFWFWFGNRLGKPVACQTTR
jgi:hypothetical protein